MSALRFSKMHGLGNDFMVIDLVRQSLQLDAAQVRRWADRHTGVGFDQLLAVLPSQRGEGEYYYQIFNADGSQVEHCGNGARCLGRFLREQGLSDSERPRIETRHGVIELQLHDDGEVSVDMGRPDWSVQAMPLQAGVAQRDWQELELAGFGVVRLATVSMGNPHAVLLCDDVEQAPVRELGAQLTNHALFVEGANIGFLQVTGRNSGRLRVYERGVGETRACGTGACAAMAVGRREGCFADSATLSLTGGDLKLHWDGQSNLRMQGPAVTVYTGFMDHDASH